MKSAKIVFKLASNKKSYRQFIKFAIVGAINTLVDWAVYFLVVFAFKVDTQMIKQFAKVISFIVSAISSYGMNRIWTFRSRNKKIIKEATRFFMVAIGGLLINSTVFYLATRHGQLRDVFGLILATAAATFWNFLFNKRWTFR